MLVSNNSVIMKIPMDFPKKSTFRNVFFQRFFVGEIPSQACRDDPGHVGADAEDRGKIRQKITTWRIIPRILSGFFLQGGAPVRLAKLVVNITPITMVYGRYIWVNFITTKPCSPEPWFIMVNKRNHPQMAARFRLVKYDNLPIYIIYRLVVWNMFHDFPFSWE